MRSVLAGMVFGVVLLVTVPVAFAADYPPRPSGTSVTHRAPARAAPVVQGAETSLAHTGGNLALELGVGAGFGFLGGAILVLTRRRQRAARG
ncbi:MAG TPA: hypothetical protein VFD04_18955 [Actinomycetes bacterium]|jgi:hypothetical protein|nr:hypothetical protein [Actinomycetes bacterium]